MENAEFEALSEANNTLYDLSAIAEDIEKAKADLEAFILEAEDQLHEAGLEEKDWSEDTQEFIAVLTQARDELDDIATWSVSSMSERLAAIRQEVSA